MVKVDCLLNCYLFLWSLRRSVPLERMVKATIWMSGLYSVGVLCGSVMSQCGSSTLPQKLCYQWRASSTAGPSMAREKCMRWPAAAITATGKPWRVFLWNPVKWDTKTSAVQHTPSSDCFHSSNQSVNFLRKSHAAGS